MRSMSPWARLCTTAASSPGTNSLAMIRRGSGISVVPIRVTGGPVTPGPHSVVTRP
jgi:hypothetical protein